MNIDFISAVCTPLDEQEHLHREGLRVHLAQQWENEMSGVLLGGTMGLMQLLDDVTYFDLIRTGAQYCRGNCETLVGVGDTSFSRTLERIETVSCLPIDGVVVVTPYFFPFSEEELFSYYAALAKASRHPLYIYYLPKLTKVELKVETILRLAEIPNIRGIKSSAATDWTMQLFERAPASFRMIISAPMETARLAQMGVSQHLDGVYAVFPRLARQLLKALRDEDWERALRCEEVLKNSLEVLRSKYPLFGATSVILNSQGVAGKCNVSPLVSLSDESAHELLDRQEIKLAIAGGLTGDNIAQTLAA